MSKYVFNILVAIDLLLAAVCGCKRNETLSAAAWSLEKDDKFWGHVWRPVIDFILCWYQYEHCKVQYEYEAKWNSAVTQD